MSFLESFRNVLRETPLGWLLLSGGCASILGAAVVAYLARNRRKMARSIAMELRSGAAEVTEKPLSPWLELAGAGFALVIPALMVLVISVSRNMILGAGEESGPSLKATALAMGIYGQLNGVALGSTLLLVQLPLAAAGLGLAASYRLILGGLGQAAALRREAHKRGEADPPAVAAWLNHPGPSPYIIPSLTLMLVLLGAAPLLAGAHAWVTQMIMSFAGVAGAAPDQKGALILLSMEEARPALLGAARLAAGGLVLALVLAAAAVLWGSPASKRRALGLAPEAHRSGKLYWSGVAACLIGAVLLTVLALPYQRENNDPLPTSSAQGRVMMDCLGVTAPKLQGPDPLKRAPQLTLSATSMGLDTVEILTTQQLSEQLEIMKHNFSLVAPDQEFPGLLVLHVAEETNAQRLQAPLKAAMAAGYQRVQFGFQQEELLNRPVLGKVRRFVESAALVRLVHGEPTDHGTYGDLARTAVSARKTGKPVILTIKK